MVIILFNPGIQCSLPCLAQTVPCHLSVPSELRNFSPSALSSLLSVSTLLWFSFGWHFWAFARLGPYPPGLGRKSGRCAVSRGQSCLLSSCKWTTFCVSWRAWVSKSPFCSGVGAWALSFCTALTLPQLTVLELSFGSCTMSSLCCAFVPLSCLTSFLSFTLFSDLAGRGLLDSLDKRIVRELQCYYGHYSSYHMFRIVVNCLYLKYVRLLELQSHYHIPCY